jgi:hypothetical protein
MLKELLRRNGIQLLVLQVTSPFNKLIWEFYESFLVHDHRHLPDTNLDLAIG